MIARAEEQKRVAVAAAAALAASRLSSAKTKVFQRFLERFYARVPADDILPRPAEELYAAALSLWQFAEVRPSGRAKLRVLNPRTETHGWHASHTLVQIVNDDMPFLVDSVAAAINASALTVHLVIHPIVRVERDAAGRLSALLSPESDQGGLESLMHAEVSAQSDPAAIAALEARIASVLDEVRAAVADWRAMRGAMRGIVTELAERAPPVPRDEAEEALAFLEWLDADNFTYLGYREYRFGAESGGAHDILPATGLGILRADAYPVFEGLRRFAALPADVQQFLREPRLLVINKTNGRTNIHRPARMDVIGVRVLDAEGVAVGIRLFLGLFTSQAYSSSPRAIPLLRRKVSRVVERAGLEPQSHDAKALVHVLETFPRDELFQIGEGELLEFAQGVVNLQERQRIALFMRRDPFERFVSCFVYVPRERYDTQLRQRFAQILEASLRGTVDSFEVSLGDSVLARAHFILRTTPGNRAEVDLGDIDRQLVEAARAWPDRLREALLDVKGEEGGGALYSAYADAFPAAYRERFTAGVAVHDIDRIEAVRREGRLAMTLYCPIEAAPGELRFKIYGAAQPVPLSEVLPVLEHMGLRVITEEPYAVHPRGAAAPLWIQDFGLLAPGEEIDVAEARPRFEQAFARIWGGEMESDGFNRLILSAGLDWRQVMVLRLLAKLLRQAGSAFSQAYMEDALGHHPEIAAALVELFERRFDPAEAGDRNAETERRAAAIARSLDAVQSLDEDRILRSFLLLAVNALRTNYFQRQGDGTPKPYLAVKFASSAIELLPLPRPMCEIYVLGPRVEADHLRGGAVARGGIRWSDRKEDFRAETLGLMKAQVVKNAVIVPTGSKGGFFVKRPPATGGRAALRAEVVECYKTFMRGLLDVTDNIVGGKVVPPERVVRFDGDDPYLVVAADKGTATFSDVANSISADYRFWLDDAFASGGSAGYDHKAMGITARGAWETVKRHFRELGRDIQREPFTCVGVGDMSGDVFGNGMLRSPETRLLAAFDHRHIFLDPDPDPAASFAERQRLFDLPASSWADYDAAKISTGGGIFPRDAKSIVLSPEIRQRLDIVDERLAPAEVIQAILRAPVDLLWFGGIGTYVKAARERHADVGDRANDALRIDAGDIRAKVVGEGANLAVMQLGRIEYSLKGGRINTDAIDNSAGVSTSDHEVNIKVLLNAVVAAGDLTMKQRNELLHQMSDEVAELVLVDNYLQGLALTLEGHEASALDAQVRLMRSLEHKGLLDRAVEFLPDDATLRTRAASRQGLTRPELAVLLAYAKITLADDLLASDVPEDPALGPDLAAYFPQALRLRFPQAIGEHRLRREIIATIVANDLVNRAGLAFAAEAGERTGRGPGEVARAYLVVRAVFELDRLWAAVDSLDNLVPAAVQSEMLLAVRRLVERAVMWFLRRPRLDVTAEIAAFRPGVAALSQGLGEVLSPSQRGDYSARVDALAREGVPRGLAEEIGRLDFLAPAADIVRLAAAAKKDVLEIARTFLAIGDRLRLDALRQAARRIEARTLWQELAIGTLEDELYDRQAGLAQSALAGRGELDGWFASHAPEVARLDQLTREITAAQPDLAMLTVATRILANLLDGRPEVRDAV